ncbi:hypothetical protein BY996DRAFT_6491311 [Phakopsora pachyrhizi]|nr:hypothetical protein BY996DRAFT_6491311 [Phakopsora pachyrhizi]
MPEEKLTRVATFAKNYQKREQAGLGRVGTDVDIAGPTTKRISQGRRRKGLCDIAGPTTQGTIAGPTEAREAMGREEAGGRPEEVSVGLVRRRETLFSKTKRRTDIGDISKAVVGRAVLSDFDIGQSK